MKIKKYHDQWEKGKAKPVVILIGGYAGTGKSTLAKKLQKHFPHIHTLAVPVVRSVLRGVIKKSENPFLFKHTYELMEIDSPLSPTERFEVQSQPILIAINEFISFAGTDRQQWLIEGNHLIPSKIHFPPTVIPVEMYLKVSSPGKHLEMLSGPTHQRRITYGQLNLAIELHDFLVQNAEKAGKPVFEYKDAYKEAVKLIEKALQ